MDWPKLINDLRARNETYESIATACRFASRGHVHDVAHGKQKSVTWEIGDALLKFHRRVVKRRPAATK